MFVAKFNQTTGAPFTSDKNGSLPFIGTVLAGPAKGTLINGTIFNRDGLQPNKAYLCDNVTEMYEGRPQVRVIIMSELTAMDIISARKELGAPSTVLGNTSANSEEPVLAEDAKGKK